MKTIELPADEFTKLRKELDKCREDKKKLQIANHYLNEQIKLYNEKFTNKGEKNGDKLG